MPVKDVARTEVVTAASDQTAGNLATLMKEENVGCVVIEADDEPIGIVTDRDLVVTVLESRSKPSEVLAGEIMTESPVTVDVDTGILQATEAMYDASVRRMPIVDENGQVAGIITMDDLLVLLTDELDNLASIAEAESPPY